MEESMMNVMENPSQFINLSEKEIQLLNPLIWAYVGDAVYELYVRSHMISMNKKTAHDLHVQSIKFAKAEAQSDFLETLVPFLTEEEANIVRRARNTKTHHVPKNAQVIDYRRATAFEGLVGYLYLLKRFERLNELMEVIFKGAT